MEAEKNQREEKGGRDREAAICILDSQYAKDGINRISMQGEEKER